MENHYNVSYLRMTGDDETGYVEEYRFIVGEIKIAKAREDVSTDDLVNALYNFKDTDPFGNISYPAKAFPLEELCCKRVDKDGLRYEVGLKSGGPPLFGLQFTHETAETKAIAEVLQQFGCEHYWLAYDEKTGLLTEKGRKAYEYLRALISDLEKIGCPIDSIAVITALDKISRAGEKPLPPETDMVSLEDILKMYFNCLGPGFDDNGKITDNGMIAYDRLVYVVSVLDKITGCLNSHAVISELDKISDEDTGPFPFCEYKVYSPDGEWLGTIFTEGIGRKEMAENPEIVLDILLKDGYLTESKDVVHPFEGIDEDTLCCEQYTDGGHIFVAEQNKPVALHLEYVDGYDPEWG